MATEQEILSFRNTVEDIRREIGKEIIGQQDVVEHMIMALVAGGLLLAHWWKKRRKTHDDL